MKTRNYRRGQCHPMAKLTDHEIRLLVSLRVRERVSMGDLAKRFGVSKATVWNYLHGKYRV